MSGNTKRTERDESTESRSAAGGWSASRRDFLRATAAAGGLAAFGPLAVTEASAGIPTPWLHRDGNLIKDSSGNTVTLRGLNIADPKRIDMTASARGMNAVQVIDSLTNESNGWYPRMIRVPVQPVDIGEYEPGSGPPIPGFDRSQLESYLTNHLDAVVQRCSERGVYCIIDYHRHRDVQWAEGQSGPVNTALQDEVDMFWDVVAPRYADQSHVLYEVYNEPQEPGMWNDPTTTEWVADIWRLWLEMAQPWVDTIRSHADNLILMGSPSWSQSPEGALVEEFSGSDIAYTYHIYPGHNSSAANDWEDASNNGEGVAHMYEEAPLFVTEFGWEEGAGQYIGGTDSGFGQPFLNWLEGSDAIHWTAWCGDPVWQPVMFDRPFADDADDSVGDPYNGTVPEDCPELPCEWELTTGSGYMGDDIKNTLADLRNDGVPGDGNGGGEDTTPPTTPSDLSVTATTGSSVSIAWAAATDSGGSGVSQYVITVDGNRDHTVATGTTETTVEELSPDTSYELGVSAVDGAGNQSEPATVSATTGSDGGGSPGDGLVVNDYDGDPSWSSNTNDLGQWCGAGSFANGSGTVSNGALVLEYDNGGWYQEQLNQSVTDYSTLVLRVSGASGGEESDITFEMGGVSA
ncbi:cellulase family glycosylhydrolase, partial [Halocatena pleomorpha]